MKYQLNKKAIKISFLDENDERAYWRSKTPAERFKAIEINRRIVYGYGDTAPRFQRFFEVVKNTKKMPKGARYQSGKRCQVPKNIVCQITAGGARITLVMASWRIVFN